MRDAKAVESIFAEQASVVIFVPFKKGMLRFCADFRESNAVAERDSYPKQRLDECIDLLGDAAMFATLDTVTTVTGRLKVPKHTETSRHIHPIVVLSASFGCWPD